MKAYHARPDGSADALRVPYESALGAVTTPPVRPVAGLPPLTTGGTGKPLEEASRKPVGGSMSKAARDLLNLDLPEFLRPRGNK
jgi:hypothetical protein